MEGLTIGQLARQAGVNLETVRYYERRGLLPEPPRRESGYRVYGKEALSRLAFIRNAKELGFSLEEILELLSLRVNRQTSCGKVKRRAEAKMIAVEEKIQALQKIRRALIRLVATCRGRGPTSACPILEKLDS